MVPRPIQHRDDLRTRLGEIAGWQTARRDDAKVALEVHRTHAIDRIWTLDEAAFFDELFHYLREIGAWPLLEQLDRADRKRGTDSVPPIRTVHHHALRRGLEPKTYSESQRPEVLLDATLTLP